MLLLIVFIIIFQLEVKSITNRNTEDVSAVGVR